MRRFGAGLLAVALALAGAAPALAQTSGSINGVVTDNTGAVLPGVTVSVQAQQATQTAVTNEQGQYRFPSLVPGTYRMTFELAGFNTLVREGIVVNLGFTATVNVQLQVASLQETVTVTGQSPVVDVTSTTSTFNITQDMLQTLPNARDIWSVMGQAPGFRVSRIDVGGSRAGTQTGFEAFGYSGQIRAQIDGVNTTEGTGAAGFYYDYGAFDEIELKADGNDASASTPGVQLNGIIKSGGNQLRGTLYIDYENENLQGNNIDADLKSQGVGQGSRILKYYDPNGDIGGPIKKDKLWYFVSLRNQDVTVTVTGFPVENPGTFGQLTRLTNGTYKLTYQLTQNNRLSHYLQYGRKLLPDRGGSSTLYRWGVFMQDSGSYAGNLEWNSVVSPQFFFRGAVSTFGYNWPNVPYGPNGELGENLDYRMTDTYLGTTTFTKGSSSADRNDRRRWQFNWDGTVYKDAWLGGNHAFKFGWLSERESQEFTDMGFKDAIQLQFRTTNPSLPHFSTPYRVVIYNRPYSTYNANWHHALYVNDQWQLHPRLSVSMGLRWEYYNSFYPDQEILPGRFREFFYGGAPVQTSAGPYALPRTPFADSGYRAPGQTGIRRHPDLFAPRFGMVWDLFGDGKTTLKANWGRFYFNPGNASGGINPVRGLSATFNWIDRNGDRLFSLDEFGTFVTASSPQGERHAPNLKDPYTDSMSVWFERELLPNIGFRAGYTFRTDGNSLQNVELARVYSLYTVQRTFADVGPDGLAGTADDGPSFIWYDIPNVPTPPASQSELRNRPEILATDRAVDFTVTKRMSNRWSLVTSYYFNWDRDRGYPQNPNAERFNDSTVTNWNFKVSGTYLAPWGFVVTPSLRHQSGANHGRFVTTSGQSGQVVTGSYAAEAPNSYRHDNIWIYDARFERRFRFGSRTISTFVDGYNLLNSNAAESRSTTTGMTTVTIDGVRTQINGFRRPTIVLSPRIFRFGIRFTY